MDGNPSSAYEYLLVYGWMLIVVSIVGGAIFVTVKDGMDETDINTTEVEMFLEERTQYTNCTTTSISADEHNADVRCSRTLDEVGNTSYRAAHNYEVEIRNSTTYLFAR